MRRARPDRVRGVRGVRRTPRSERAADAADPKTPGYRKILIPPYSPRRGDSRAAGGTRTPVPPLASPRTQRCPPASHPRNLFALHARTSRDGDLWRIANGGIGSLAPPELPRKPSKTQNRCLAMILKHHVKQRDWRQLYAQRRRLLG